MFPHLYGLDLLTHQTYPIWEGLGQVSSVLADTNRRVRGTTFVIPGWGGYSREIRVSTVFLIFDHAFGLEGVKPLLFETMIFGGKRNDYCQRYATWDEAVAGHAEAVDLVKLTIPFWKRYAITEDMLPMPRAPALPVPVSVLALPAPAETTGPINGGKAITVGSD
jgi:hypothetical protein